LKKPRRDKGRDKTANIPLAVIDRPTHADLSPDD
jgi:hypothetical protein